MSLDAIRRLRSEGLSVLVVEQNTSKALEAADRAYVLSSGRLIWSGEAAVARKDASIVQSYMGSQ